MNKNNYTYCVRLTLLPDEYSQKRIENLVKDCVECGFKDVMFFINAEEYNLGHITIEEARPFVEVLKKAKKELARHGITTSLNPWTTTLHTDRNRALKPSQKDFTTMADPSGRKASAVACPLSRPFVKYLCGLWTYFIEEIMPDVIWVEDDFRLHNHDPLLWGGCFCELHMKEFSKRLGFEISREKFVAEILKDNAGNSVYRTAFADVFRETMVNFAKEIGETVKKASNGKTRVGLMTSVPEVHQIEYRDWENVLKNLCCDYEPVVRPHLLAYEQVSAMEYCWNFNRITMMTRACLPENTLILPELENAPFTLYNKSNAFTGLLVESSLPLVTCGITLDTYGFDGNGIIKEWNLQKEFKRLQPYMKAVNDLGLKFSSLQGVIVPTSGESVKSVKPVSGGSLEKLLPDESWFASYLSSFGIAYKYSHEKKFKNYIIAVSGQWFRNLTESEIVSLFKDNYVILNGEAAHTLIDMGLGRLIYAKSCEWVAPLTNNQAYEKAEKGLKILDIDEIRCSSQIQCPMYLKIGYEDNAPVEIYTKQYMSDGKEYGLSHAGYNNFYIFPYEGRKRHAGLFHPLHEFSLKSALFKQSFRSNFPIMTNGNCLSPYYYLENNALILINFTDDDLEKTQFILPANFKFNKIYILSCESCRINEVDYEKTGGLITIDEPVKRYGSKVIIFK